MEDLCFRKPLSKTDVDGYLEIPKAAKYLPTGNELMNVQYQNEDCWQFRALTRKDGRRCFTGNWRNFTEAASPNIGDTFKYYFLKKSNRYVVQIERQLLDPEGLPEYLKGGPQSLPVEAKVVEPSRKRKPDLILFGAEIFI